MARLPRLAVAGLPHYVIQRGHNGGAIVADDADREAFLRILLEAARLHDTAVHAYALLDTEFHLVATPATERGLSQTMQALGRRHAALYNRRHRRSGALWDGRYRATVLEPGAARLAAVRMVDGMGGFGEVGIRTDPLCTSAGHRLGHQRLALISDPVEYWQLGNTPFDREARYAELLARAMPEAERAQLRHAALQGWAYGSEAFIEQLAGQTARPLRPRPRGRPAHR